MLSPLPWTYLIFIATMHWKARARIKPRMHRKVFTLGPMCTPPYFTGIKLGVGLEPERSIQYTGALFESQRKGRSLSTPSFFNLQIPSATC